MPPRGEQGSVFPSTVAPNFLSQLRISIDFPLEAAGNHSPAKLASGCSRVLRVLGLHFYRTGDIETQVQQALFLLFLPVRNDTGGDHLNLEARCGRREPG